MKRTKIAHILLALAISAIMVSFYLLGLDFFDLMELKTLDLRFFARGKLEPSKHVVLAVIDEKSLDKEGHWPWPRYRLASLVNTLSDAGARVIGFDIGFFEKEKDDAILASAFKKSKAKIVLGYFFHLSGDDSAYLEKTRITSEITKAKYPIVSIPNKEEVANLPLITAFAPEASVDIIAKAAHKLGYFNIIRDKDGAVRWAPLVITWNNTLFLPLSLQCVQAYLNTPTILKLGEDGVKALRLGKTPLPVDDYGRLLINYYGPSSFPTYSITDILQGRTDTSAFKDKIVLIGATAIGLYDMVVTPFSNVFPGLEVQATIIDNILNNSFLVQPKWSDEFDVIIIIVLGLISGLILSRLRLWSSVLIGAIIFSGYLYANHQLFIKGYWLNLVYPLTTLISSFLVVISYQYLVEEKEKRQIKGAFVHYVSSKVVDEILKDPEKLSLGGAKRELSMLFSDIRDFTSISERLKPEALVQLLNEYLSLMTEIVFKYDGLLDKYIGDAIMAVYGAPLPQSDHPQRACLTALEMIRALKVLQPKWMEATNKSLNIGIGINTGQVIVGNMGSETRFDYTVVGDHVNLASRLEGLNKFYKTNIVLSEFTYQFIKDKDFICRELDLIRVKGKVEPVRIYEMFDKEGNNLKEVAQIFEEGIILYRKRDWDKAISLFERVKRIMPEDKPAKVYLERCNFFKQQPPPPDWDGVFVMREK